MWGCRPSTSQLVDTDVSLPCMCVCVYVWVCVFSVKFFPVWQPSNRLCHQNTDKHHKNMRAVRWWSLELRVRKFVRVFGPPSFRFPICVVVVWLLKKCWGSGTCPFHPQQTPPIPLCVIMIIIIILKKACKSVVEFAWWCFLYPTPNLPSISCTLPLTGPVFG